MTQKHTAPTTIMGNGWSRWPNTAGTFWVLNQDDAGRRYLGIAEVRSVIHDSVELDSWKVFHSDTKLAAMRDVQIIGFAPCELPNWPSLSFVYDPEIHKG